MDKYDTFNTLPSLLTVKDVMNILKVSRSYVMSLIYSQKLPAHKIAGQWRILRSDIVDYILHT